MKIISGYNLLGQTLLPKYVVQNGQKIRSKSIEKSKNASQYDIADGLTDIQILGVLFTKFKNVTVSEKSILLIETKSVFRLLDLLTIFASSLFALANIFCGSDIYSEPCGIIFSYVFSTVGGSWFASLFYRCFSKNAYKITNITD
ncbi:MAG: hypothetical protein LBB53_01490 [Prevotellaceae bacterium]|jgi:hypothetical protein|nr:hypothetical protein [Prevotellaceae bacterium]